MLSVLLYAAIDGVRSSRDIEDHCRTDVVYRMLCGDQAPDHTTISRFRQRYRLVIRDLFTRALSMCHLAGLVDVRKLFVDGTKIDANASLSANRTLEQVQALVDALLAEEAAADQADDDEDPDTPAKRRGRADRSERLDRAGELLDAAQDKHAVAAEAAGRPVDDKAPKANTTDPDSRIMKTRKGYLQGYNAQAVVTVGQIIVAAQVTNEANDYAQLHPMITLSQSSCLDAGITRRIRLMCGDAGYMSEANVASAPLDCPMLLLACGNDFKDQRTAREGTHRADMIRTLHSEPFREAYDLRKTAIEPVFGNLKYNSGFTGLKRRGLEAANDDWLLETTAHNLKKLHTDLQRLRKSLAAAINPTKNGPKPGSGAHPSRIRTAIKRLTTRFRLPRPHRHTQHAHTC